MRLGCPCPARQRHGWWIVATAFTVDALSLGGRALFSVVMLFFEAEWGWSRAEASSLMALVHVCNGLATLLSGHLADTMPASVAMGGGVVFLALCYGLVAAMYYEWQVWLFYGVLCGSAFGALNLNVFSVAVLRCMPKRLQGIAVGVATSGSTFGMFVLVPLFTLVAGTHGWRVGYVAMCIVTSSLVLPAIYLLRRSERAPPPTAAAPSSTTATAATESKETAAPAAEAAESGEAPAAPAVAAPPDAAAPPLRTKLRTLGTSRAFWLLSLMFMICGVTTTGFVETHVVAVAVDRGMSIEIGSLSFSVLSAFNGLGMLLAGWLTDRYSRALILGCIFAIRGLDYLLLYATRSPPPLFAFAVIFGLVDYSVVPPVVSLVGSHAGQHTVGLGVGILLAWHSLAAALGSYVGGAVFDAHGTYDAALLGCAAICGVAAVAAIGLAPGEPLRRKAVHEREGAEAVEEEGPTTTREVVLVEA